MGKLSSTTSSWPFIFLVSLAVCTGANGFASFSAAEVLGQASCTATGAATANTNPSQASALGALYGEMVGNRDGTLRLAPNPRRDFFYRDLSKYKPAYGTLADYKQEYRSAFVKAYHLSYEKALKPTKRQGQ